MANGLNDVWAEFSQPEPPQTRPKPTGDDGLGDVWAEFSEPLDERALPEADKPSALKAAILENEETVLNPPVAPDTIDKIDAVVNDMAIEAAKLNDGPLPKTPQEAIRMASERGLSLRHFEGFHSQLAEPKARMYAIQMAKEMGIYDYMSPKDFADLTNAYRYNLVVQNSPVAREEVPRVLADFSGALTQFGKQAAQDRLIEMANEGVQPGDPRMVKFQEVYARFLALESRLDDESVRNGVLHAASLAATGDRSERAQGALRAVDWILRPNLTDPETQAATLGMPVANTNEHISSYILKDLRALLEGTEQKDEREFLLAAWEASIGSARNRMMGTEGLPFEASVLKTHPELLARLRSQVPEREARGVGEKPMALVDEWMMKKASTPAKLMAAAVSPETALETLKVRSPERVPTGFAASTMQVLGVLGAALEGSAEVVDFLDQAAYRAREYMPDGIRKVGGLAMANGLAPNWSAFTNAFATAHPSVKDSDMETLRQQVADGRVSPALLVAAAQTSDQSVVGANLALLLATTQNRDEIAARLQGIQQNDPSAITPDTVMAVIEEAQKEGTEQFMQVLEAHPLGPMPEAEVDAITKRTAESLKKDPWSKTHFGNIIASTVATMSAQYRDTLRFAVSDNDRLIGEAAFGFATGFGARATGGLIKRSSVAQSIGKWNKARRSANALAALSYWDPHAAEALKDAAGKALTPGKVDERLDTVQALSNVLSRRHRADMYGLDGDEAAAAVVQSRRKSAAHLRSQLRALDPLSLNQVLSEVEGNAAIQAAISGKQGLGLVSEYVMSAVQKVTRANPGLGKYLNLYEKYADQAANLAATVEDAVVRGVGEIDAKNVPLSLPGMRHQGTKLVDRVRRSVLGGDAPTLGGTEVAGSPLGPLQDMQRQSYAGQVWNFVDHHLKVSSEWRNVVAQQRLQVETTVDLVTEKWGNRLIEIDDQIAMATNKTVQDELLAMRDAVKLEHEQLLTAGKLIRGRSLDDGIDLTKITINGRKFHELLTTDDVYMLGETFGVKQEHLGTHLARSPEQAEFYDKLIIDPDSLSDMKFGEYVKARDGLKKEFLKEFAKQDSFLTNPYLVEENAERFVVGTNQARREIARRRLAARKAAGPGKAIDPDDELGVVRAEHKEQWQRLQEIRQDIDSALGEDWTSRWADLDTGAHWANWVHHSRQVEADLRIRNGARLAQQDQLEQAYRALGPDGQKAFDSAVRRAGEGHFKDMNEFFRKNPTFEPMMVNRLGAEKSQAVRALLDNTENFRMHLLLRAERAGLIEADELDRLAGAYNPHLFKAYLNPQLLSKAAKALPEDTVQRLQKVSGLDLDEFMAQRSLTRHKVLVKVKGQGTQVKEFANAKDANDYIKKLNVVEGSEEVVGADKFYRTQFGDRVSLMQPLGPKDAEILGLVGSGKGLFARLHTLVRDIGNAEFFNHLGAAAKSFDEDSFTKFLADKPAAARNYVKMPEGKAYGKLSGKYVHKNVMRELRSFSESYDALSDMSAALRDAVWDVGTLTGWFASTVVQNWNSAGTRVKNALSTNLISRNVPTSLGNVLMDRVFAGMADPTNGGYLGHTGRTSRQFALHMLMESDGWTGSLKNLAATVLGKRKRLGLNNRVLEALDPEDARIMNEILESGIIDETVIGTAGVDKRHHRFIAEMLYGDYDGPSQMLPSINLDDAIHNPVRAIDEAARAGGKGAWTSLKRLFGLELSKQEQVLAKRLQKVEGELASGPEALGEQKFAALAREQAVLTAQLEKPNNNMKRAGHAFMQVVGFLMGKSKGVAGEVEAASRMLYGRLGNVHRVGLYHFLRKQGWSQEDAVTRINMFMQNYSAVPRGLQAVSRATFGATIASFPYEMMRIQANWIKHHPIRALAYMSAVPLVNMISMAGMGIDPITLTETLRTQSGGMPAEGGISSQLVYPTLNGEVGTFSIPGVNMLAMARGPYGTLSGMEGIFGTPAGDTTIAEDMTLMAANGISKFVLSSPQSNAAYSFFSGRNALSGRLYSNTWERFTDPAAQLAQTFIPAHVPGIGANARQAQEYLRAPPTKTGRTVTNAEILAQELAGFRFRGGLIESMATGLGVEKGLKKAADFLVDAMTAAPNELVRHRLAAKGFSHDDYINTLAFSARKLDPSAKPADIRIDPEYDTIRRAAALHREGKAAGDQAQMQYARDLINEAVAGMQRKTKTAIRIGNEEIQLALAEFGEGMIDKLPKEVIDVMVKAVKAMDPVETINNLSPVQAAYVFSKGMRSKDVPDEYWDALVNAQVLTERNSLSEGGNPTGLRQAIELVDRAIASRANYTDRNLARLVQLRDTWAVRLVQAETNQVVQDAVDQDRRAARELLEESVR